MTTRLVIFDCDGVLVDSEHLSNNVLAQFITETGWPMTPSESTRQFVGRRMDDVMATISNHIGRPLPEGWLQEYERRRDEAFTRELKPVVGIEFVLAELKRHAMHFCVASSAPLSKMHFTLRLTGLRPYFPDDILFSARELPRGKPFPDVFLHAAQKMGFKPKDCIVIEDSLAGVAAAQAAGMRCYAYAADTDPAPLAERGAHCFTNMKVLPELLGILVLNGPQ